MCKKNFDLYPILSRGVRNEESEEFHIFDKNWGFSVFVSTVFLVRIYKFQLENTEIKIWGSIEVIQFSLITVWKVLR